MIRFFVVGLVLWGLSSAFASVEILDCLESLRKEAGPKKTSWKRAIEFANWWKHDGERLSVVEPNYPLQFLLPSIEIMKARLKKIKSPNAEIERSKELVLSEWEILERQCSVGEYRFLNVLLASLAILHRMQEGRWPWSPIEPSGESSVMRVSDTKDFLKFKKYWRTQDELAWEGPDGGTFFSRDGYRRGKGIERRWKSPLFFSSENLDQDDYAFLSTTGLSPFEVPERGRAVGKAKLSLYRFIEHQLTQADQIEKHLNQELAYFGGREKTLLARLLISRAMVLNRFPSHWGDRERREFNAYYSYLCQGGPWEASRFGRRFDNFIEAMRRRALREPIGN